ncbi:hypothetical protein V8C35DRAFT_285326 [Trichoderma chlorosporum]
MTDGLDQPELLEELLRIMRLLLEDTEAGQTLAQLQPTLQDLHARHRRKPTRFFFGPPASVGPNCEYPDAFKFRAGPETYELVGSGPEGRLTQEEQAVANKAMEDIGMPVEELKTFPHP